ncbi:hypothetical protein [Roseibium sp.]|uniref:hypothetical protein n=1 Tax=Roseibium sp. TaxID=1936156 RepID=UPI003B52366C
MQPLPDSVRKSMDTLFGARPLVSHALAAKFIGIHARTLTRWGDDGLIFYRLRGNRRAYAKEDIAEALNGAMEGNASCPSISNGKPTGKPASGSSSRRTINMISSSRSTGTVVDFTAQLEKRQKAARKNSKSGKNGA